jgi:hypothetical protein
MVERKGEGWGEPRNLGAPINSPGAEWFPTLAADGTLYFGSDWEGGKGGTDLWRSRLREAATSGSAISATEPGPRR